MSDTVTVWFHAPSNEIIVRDSIYRVSRGVQGANYCEAAKAWIPDYLDLFRWRINLKQWKKAIKKGWLIKLGSL